MHATRSTAAGLTMALLLALVGVAVMSPGAQAAGSLDQEQGAASACFLDPSAAQSFTAGRSGELDRIDIWLDVIDPPTGTVTVELRPVDAGDGPTTTILATSSMAAAAAVDQGWTTFAFAAPAIVRAGTTYSIVMSQSLTAGTVGFCHEKPGPYAGGIGFSGSTSPPTTFTARPGLDLAFRTYVEAHEFSVSATSHDFGDQTVGTPTRHAKVFFARNDGTVPVVIGRVTMLGASDQFLSRGDACSGKTLPAGERCFVMIDFVPLSTGAKSATLRFTHDAVTGSPTDVALTGNGVPAPAPAPDGAGDELPAPGAGPDPGPVARCHGLVATIAGTRGRDRLRGTMRRDVIAGLGGRDRILGLGGNDVICGGAGHDWISGNAGRDRIFGGSGNDRLKGAAGRDALAGGAGLDHLRQ